MVRVVSFYLALQLYCILLKGKVDGKRPVIKLIFKPQQGITCYKPVVDKMIYQIHVVMDRVFLTQWPNPLVLEILSSNETKDKEGHSTPASIYVKVCELDVQALKCNVLRGAAICTCQQLNTTTFSYKASIPAKKEYSNADIRVRTDSIGGKTTEFSPMLKVPFVVRDFLETMKLPNDELIILTKMEEKDPECIIPMGSSDGRLDYCVYYLKAPYTVKIRHGNNEKVNTTSRTCVSTTIYYSPFFPVQNNVYLSFREAEDCGRRQMRRCVMQTMKDIINSKSKPTNSDPTETSGTRTCAPYREIYLAVLGVCLLL